MASLKPDVEALASMTRDSAGPGERAAAAWVAERLRAVGASDVRVEPFRYQGTYAWAHAAHAAAGLLAARLRSRTLALAALASLELEVSGRAQWIRRVLPATEGANVVARVPARGEKRGTLVLVAHHDAAHTGLPWHPAIQESGAERKLRRRTVDPFQAPTALGFLLVALGARRVGSALLAASIVADLDIARSPTVPGASDNATGVAAVIALAERFAADPLEHVEIEIVSTGCEESGMGGMAAYLRKRKLGESPLICVLGLDTLGAGTPIVCRGEGTILTHRYRDEDLDLADAGARRAGVEPPQRWRIGGWTDPILARFAGLPTISMLSIGPKGSFTNYHRMTDVPEAVDWASTEHCLALAEGIAREFGARVG